MAHPDLTFSMAADRGGVHADVLEHLSEEVRGDPTKYFC